MISQSGTPQAKDFYTASVANDYDLDLTNLGKAKDVQTKLSFANKPTTVELRSDIGFEPHD